MHRAGLKLAGVGALAVFSAACQPSREELIAEHAATIERYCLDCHNQAERAGELALEPVRLENVAANPDKWERVVRKLRAGMMPPVDQPRPEHATYGALAGFLERELDARTVTEMPAPGLHRLNRVEYGNAVRDLLALDIDPAAFLPADDVSRGFDNQAGTLGLSPALLEAYLGAAGKISRLALGRVEAPTQALYRVAADATQNYHVEGLPFGTRGGLAVEHTFPADAEYNIKVYSVNLGNMGNFRPFGEVRGEQLEIVLDGARVALIDWDEAFNLNRGFGGGDGQLQTIDVRVPVSAGPHRVGVTFLATNYAPGLDINRAFERSTIETGGLPGFSFYPHIGSVRIDGPYEPTGVSETPSRKAILKCTPAADASAEEACAREIMTSLVRRAFRGAEAPADIETLLEFYRSGRAASDFEGGIELALQRLLADPKFIYRVEHEPADLKAGDPYAIDDVELASRLSFFLWSSIPDEELLALAEQGRLGDPKVLEQQVRRMLADPRSEALTANFAGQWLNLRALEGHVPVASLFPDFDDNLRQSFRRETELFFDSLVRENRPAMELITADYTFVDERLAKHYGISGVYGSRFQRVTLDEEHDARRGLLGKGSLLATSSQPIRTSPVIRGYWVLQNLLGVPPPPPPADVPELETPKADAAGNARVPSMREQMEHHRDNPACVGCHQLMDPIGFALEQFDAIGGWRTTDGDNTIDATSVMYDGTPINGVADLRAFLLRYEDQFVRNATEKLLTYALGRGVEYYDMPVVRKIVTDAAKDDYRFASLIVGVVQSEPFRSSRKAGEVVAAGAADAAAATAAVSN